jgi:formylglycine-generating enzyme
MNPDTLIFHIAGAQCRLDITQGAVVYVGSDVRADVCLQSPGVAPAHCAIEMLAEGRFRLATLDGQPTLTINGTATHDICVKAPFRMVIDDQSIDVTLESIAKGNSSEVGGTLKASDLLGVPSSSASLENRPSDPATEKSFISGLLANTSLGPTTKVALAGLIAFGCFSFLDEMFHEKKDPEVAEVVTEDLIELEDFMRQFTLGSFTYTVEMAQRVSLDGSDDLEMHFADAAFGPWEQEEKEEAKPEGNAIYAVQLKVTNNNEQKSQPFSAEFFLTNLKQENFLPDADLTQKLISRMNLLPMPSEVEPAASHSLLIAFEVPNEALMEMLILVATEPNRMSKEQARIGLNTKSLMGKIMKLAKVLNHLTDQRMISMSEMNAHGETAGGGKWTSGNGVLMALGNGASMVFRYCEDGQFSMGSLGLEEGRHESEKLANVDVSRGFWMAETECTQKQWSALMNQNPSHFRGKDLPVESITWEQANAFISRLNALPHLSAEWRRNWTFTLPSEAQWEYACRAGLPSSFNNGTFYSRRLGTVSPADPVAWFAENTGAISHESGTKSPNQWGLYDMHGNVWEWCQDWYYPRLIGGINPEGPANGSERVLRGGGFSSPESEIRAARRTRLPPNASYASVGFRVAIVKKAAVESPAAKVAQAPQTVLDP